MKKYGTQWDYDDEKEYKYEDITKLSNWGTVYYVCSRWCDNKCTAQHGMNCNKQRYQTDIKRKYRRDVVLTKQQYGFTLDYDAISQFADMNTGEHKSQVPYGTKARYRI